MQIVDAVLQEQESAREWLRRKGSGSARAIVVKWAEDTRFERVLKDTWRHEAVVGENDEQGAVSLAVDHDNSATAGVAIYRRDRETGASFVRVYMRYEAFEPRNFNKFLNLLNSVAQAVDGADYWNNFEGYVENVTFAWNLFCEKARDA